MYYVGGTGPYTEVKAVLFFPITIHDSESMHFFVITESFEKGIKIAWSYLYLDQELMSPQRWFISS